MMVKMLWWVAAEDSKSSSERIFTPPLKTDTAVLSMEGKPQTFESEVYVHTVNL